MQIQLQIIPNETSSPEVEFSLNNKLRLVNTKIWIKIGFIKLFLLLDTLYIAAINFWRFYSWRAICKYF